MKVKGYIDGTLFEENIDDYLLSGGGNKKTKCPVCPQVGKRNIKDTPLSIDRTNKRFKCHKCTWAGYYGEDNNNNISNPTEKKYKTPLIKNHTDLSLDHLQLFSKRLINQNTVKRNKIKSIVGKDGQKKWFAFVYYQGDTPVKVKYKTKEKKIYQEPGCKPWIYKYNDVINQEEIIITEGEEEALIWEEAGFKYACSVDSGAPNANDKNVDGKLKCITNCYDVFEKAKTVIVAVDNDPNGRRLQTELIKRIGAEKCKTINFHPCKDANEYALKFGVESLKKLKDKAKDVKIEGIITLDDCAIAMLDAYKNGQSRGTTTFFPLIDPKWTWRIGEVNIWTGYNNEGKSQFLKQLQVAKSLGSGWSHAIFSPEEWPAHEIFTDLIESFIGKSADPDKARYNNYMTLEEFQIASAFIREHFYYIYPEEDHSIDELLRFFQMAIRKYGVKTITIDPYNQIHHKMEYGDREDLYISRFLSKIKRFAVINDVCFNIVAHQKTPPIQAGKNRPTPDVYLISGGANFSNKADNVISIYRPNYNTDYKDPLVHFTSGKIKKQKLTGIPGTVALSFNRNTNRYSQGDGYTPLQDLVTQYMDKNAKEYEENLFKQREVPF